MFAVTELLIAPMAAYVLTNIHFQRVDDYSLLTTELTMKLTQLRDVQHCSLRDLLTVVLSR